MGIALMEKELKQAKYEYQLKVRTSIDEKSLIKIGAKKLGTAIHEDTYYVPRGKQIRDTREMLRLRKEGDENLLFTYKGPIANKKMRARQVLNKVINKKQAEQIKNKYDEILDVSKKRTSFFLDSVVINLDEVENVGNFIEFEIANEKYMPKLFGVMKRLGISQPDLIYDSYFELALLHQNPVNRLMLKFYDRFGRFAFGISSAVLTTLGVIVGLNSATTSLLAVISGIVAIAIADSLSDSMGMYAAKKSERGVSTSSAFRSATNVFIGKLIFTLTFIIPFIIFPPTIGIIASIIWGFFLLALVNLQIAYIHQENIPKSILKNLLIATVMIILTYLAGKGIDRLILK